MPELDTSVFMLPEETTKNGEERIVVLNQIARSVIESQRGKHREYVFTYNGERIARINNHAWRKARSRVGLPLVRVHDLRHTFGHRLRAAGVSFEDRQDLLGFGRGEKMDSRLRRSGLRPALRASVGSQARLGANF